MAAPSLVTCTSGNNPQGYDEACAPSSTNFCSWVSTGTPPTLDKSIVCDASLICSGGQTADIIAVTNGNTYAITLDCNGTETACCIADEGASGFDIEHIYLYGTTSVDTVNLQFGTGPTYDLAAVSASRTIDARVYTLGADDVVNGSDAASDYTEYFYTSTGEDTIACAGGGPCHVDAGNDKDDVTGTNNAGASDYVDLGDGDDICDLQDGNDYLWDGPGDDKCILGLGADHSLSEGGTDKICGDGGSFSGGGALTCDQSDPGTGGIDEMVAVSNASGTATLEGNAEADKICLGRNGDAAYGQGSTTDILFVSAGVSTFTANCGGSAADGTTNRSSGTVNCTYDPALTSCPVVTSGWTRP